MKGWLINILFLQISIPALAGSLEIRASNLKDLLDAKNARVSAAKLELEAAKERTGILPRSFLPAVEIYGAQESFTTGNQAHQTQPAYGAELKMNLFNGGRDQIESEIRDLTKEKKAIEGQRVMMEELEKARLALWQILYIQAKLKLLATTIEINSQNLAAALKRIKSGIATDSDRFEFEMKNVDLKREMAALNMELSHQRRMLALLLGKEDQEEMLTFPESLSHDHDIESMLIHSAKDHEFLYKENEIRANQLSLVAKKNSREWWPKLDVFAAHNQFNEREKEFPNASDRAESVIGARISFSLSAGLEGGRESAAVAKESAAENQIARLAKREVESHIKSEMAELSFLHGQVHDAEENINRAERYYKLTQSEYARGVKNSPDVLGAAEKLFDMRHKKLEIVRDFQRAKAHILSKIGK